MNYTLKRGDTLSIEGGRARLNGEGTALIYAFHETSLTMNGDAAATVALRRGGEVPSQRVEPARASLLQTCTALVLAFFASVSWAQHGHQHMVTAADLKWSDVPSLPAGAKIAVIEGPMNQAVPFTVRLKFPANYRIPPHHHPAVERVTVLSGSFHMGMGEKFDQRQTQAVEPGGVMIMQPGTPHFAWTSVETVVQLHGTGPWGVTYLNPNDDPRKQ